MTDVDLNRLNEQMSDEEESANEQTSTTSRMSKRKETPQLTSRVQSMLNGKKRKRPQFTAEMLIGTKGLLRLSPAVVNFANRVDNKRGKEVIYIYQIYRVFILKNFRD